LAHPFVWCCGERSEQNNFRQCPVCLAYNACKIFHINIYMCREQHFVFDPVHLFLQTRAASQGKVPHHKDFTTQILRDNHLLSMREPDPKWVWSASTVAFNEMATNRQQATQ
jgi:hypothetical protein